MTAFMLKIHSTSWGSKHQSPGDHSQVPLEQVMASGDMARLRDTASGRSEARSALIGERRMLLTPDMRHLHSMGSVTMIGGPHRTAG